MNYFLGFTENVKILRISEDGLTQSYIPIKNIKPGDTVVSAKSGKPTNVIHCGYKKVEHTRLICLKKDCFGNNYPFEDVIISDNLRIIMNILNTNSITTFPLILFSDKIIDVSFNNPINLYNIDLEDNAEGIIVSGLPIQSLEINGLWNKLNMTSN